MCGAVLRHQFSARSESVSLVIDGNPVPQTNPSDRQKLMQATAKYKDALETSEKRARMAKMKIAECQQQTQKYLALAKQAQRAAAMAAAALKKRNTMSDADRASSRVQDTIAALSLTADKRRDQLNQKRASSTSSTWVQNLPGIPGPLRRSLWHKMHRRRQQIVLRPSQELLAADLKKSILETLKNDLPESSKSAELVKAEQAFLVAVYPATPKNERLRTVPSTSAWGEPGTSVSNHTFLSTCYRANHLCPVAGWHLVLDVPKESHNHLLPRPFVAPFVASNLSEILSAPGRQAASLIRTTHLRSLAAPLSAISTVTSLSETNPAVAMSMPCT